MKLNDDAKAVLRDAGVSQAAWARANYMADGKWTGDPCGCPDSGRCMNGYHHMPDEECGCLRTLLAEYLKGEGIFAEFPAGVREAALARGLLQIADAAGMPDTFWQYDRRVRIAREVLGVPEDGRYTHAHLWAAEEAGNDPLPR